MGVLYKIGIWEFRIGEFLQISERIVIEKWVWNTPSQIVEAQIPEKYIVLKFSESTSNWETYPTKKFISGITSS